MKKDLHHHQNILKYMDDIPIFSKEDNQENQENRDIMSMISSLKGIINMKKSVIILSDVLFGYLTFSICTSYYSCLFSTLNNIPFFALISDDSLVFPSLKIYVGLIFIKLMMNYQ